MAARKKSKYMAKGGTVPKKKSKGMARGGAVAGKKKSKYMSKMAGGGPVAGKKKGTKYMSNGGGVKGKPGLYANIHAKRRRIAAGSGETMRKPGTPGAPKPKNFRDAAKTAKKPIKKRQKA